MLQKIQWLSRYKNTNTSNIYGFRGVVQFSRSSNALSHRENIKFGNKNCLFYVGEMRLIGMARFLFFYSNLNMSFGSWQEKNNPLYCDKCFFFSLAFWWGKIRPEVFFFWWDQQNLSLEKSDYTFFFVSKQYCISVSRPYQLNLNFDNTVWLLN